MTEHMVYDTQQRRQKPSLCQLAIFLLLHVRQETILTSEIVIQLDTYSRPQINRSLRALREKHLIERIPLGATVAWRVSSTPEDLGSLGILLARVGVALE